MKKLFEGGLDVEIEEFLFSILSPEAAVKPSRAVIYLVLARLEANYVCPACGVQPRRSPSHHHSCPMDELMCYVSDILFGEGCRVTERSAEKVEGPF